MVGHEDAGDLVLDDGPQPPTAAATTGVPLASASAATSPERLVVRGDGDDVGRPVPAHELVARDGRAHDEPVAHAHLVGEGLELADRRRAAAGATEDDERRHGLPARGEDAERPDEHVGALERLHAPGEEDEAAVGGQAQPGPQRAPPLATLPGVAGRGARCRENSSRSTPGGTTCTRAGSAA